MTSYQRKEANADKSLGNIHDISSSKNNIPQKISYEYDSCKLINKDKVSTDDINKIEKQMSIPINMLPCGSRQGYNQIILSNNIKKNKDFITFYEDSNRNSPNNKKIEGQKLKNLPITTCMKKNIYDYEGKNNLNSEILSNYKEMDIDNVFSMLLIKVKEKKDKNVEPRKLSELKFNNFVNKGPLKFFNVVINRKIPENQYSRAFLPIKKCESLIRSSQSSIHSNICHQDLINKKINYEKNKIVKNEYTYHLNEDCKESGENRQSVNKESIYNSENEMHQNIRSSSEKLKCIIRSDFNEEETKINIEKSSIDSFQHLRKNDRNSPSLEKASILENKINEEMKVYVSQSENEFQGLNSQIECKSDKVIELKYDNKKDLLKASGHSNTDIRKNQTQRFETCSKNNHLNDSFSNDTTNTNSHNSPANSISCNISNKPIINSNILNIDREQSEFLKKKRLPDWNENNTIHINKKSSKFNTINPEDSKEIKMNDNLNLIDLTKQNSDSIYLTLSEKRPESKLPNLKYESSSNLINKSAVKYMFNQCLSKNAAANLNSIYPNKLNDFNEKDLSPYMKINLNPNREVYLEKKKDDYSENKNYLSFNNNKRNEIESKVDSYFNNSSDCKVFKNTEFNPNYKVESSLNVNVNLVTYPDYFANSKIDDKVSLDKNASINLSNPSANYSKNFQNVFSSSTYPATNISNFANININNTLPQILINPSTNINNQNFNNPHSVDCFTKKENENISDSKRNYNYDIKESKEIKFNDKFKGQQNVQKGNYQKDVLLQKSTDINSFKNLLKQRKITFQEIHHELDYQLKFNLEKTNSCFEITIDNHNTKILNLINYDNKIGQKVIEIKNINSDTNEVINFNFNKIKTLLNE